MRGRRLVLVAFLVGVVGLVVLVLRSAPAGNPLVYDYRFAAAPAGVSLDPGVTFDVAPLRAVGFEADPALRWLAEAPGLIVTASRDITLQVPPAGPDAVVEVVVEGFGGGTASVPGGRPTPVVLGLLPGPASTSIGRWSPPTDPRTVELTIAAGGRQVGTLAVRLTAAPLTGDDLGIPGAVDVPDERLPRPAPRQARPAQLADGRPVWLVDDGGEVRVFDARSPHRFSGLVGWCGSMRAFIDSIGNDVFTAAGAPVFGPAPHGLVPYETVVAGEHVVITRRLPPAPWTPDAPQAEVDGPGCQIDQPTAQAANEAGFYLEDFRGDASWVQHDLGDWPPLDGATADGWYRTDRLDEPGLPPLRGDLLVQRVRGRIVDGAAPPGVARQYVAGVPDGTYRWLLAAAGGGTPVFQRAVWVTPASLHPADRPPARRDRHLVPIHTLTDIPVRPDTPIPAAGELVDVTIEDGIVVWVEAR